MYKLVIGVVFTTVLMGCTTIIDSDEVTKRTNENSGVIENGDVPSYIVTDEPYVDPTPIYNIPYKSEEISNVETLSISDPLSLGSVNLTKESNFEFTLKNGLLKKQINNLLGKYFSEYTPYWEEGVDFNEEWFGEFTLTSEDRWGLLNKLLDSYSLSLKVKKNDVLHFNKVSK